MFSYLRSGEQICIRAPRECLCVCVCVLTIVQWGEGGGGLMCNDFVCAVLVKCYTQREVSTVKKEMKCSEDSQIQHEIGINTIYTK